MFGALTTFASESGIIQRERASKSYHVLPYYLARFICDIPLRVGQGLLFGEYTSKNQHVYFGGGVGGRRLALTLAAQPA
jgi:hypothetical protein